MSWNSEQCFPQMSLCALRVLRGKSFQRVALVRGYDCLARLCYMELRPVSLRHELTILLGTVQQASIPLRTRRSAMFGNLFQRSRTNWSLAYAHSERGECLEGRKADLIDAVLGGQSVRFRLSIDDYEYVTDAQCLWIWRDNVYAQNTSHVSMDFFRTTREKVEPVHPNAFAKPEITEDPTSEYVLRFQDASYWWMLLADTQGNLDMTRWSVGDHEARGHDQQRVPMKWYVQTG